MIAIHTQTPGCNHQQQQQRFPDYLPQGCPHTGIYVPGAAERVQVVYAWIHDLINWRLRTGGMWLPAPITTQLFNPLSSGFQSFEDAR